VEIDERSAEMERILRDIHTLEFRAQAVKWGSLKKWLQTTRAGKLGDIGKGQPPSTDLELELTLKRQLNTPEGEVDLPKREPGLNCCFRTA
jgi:hypothetical protein